MNRYNNGKIYSIRSHQTDDVYIGSTCMLLSKRLYQHKINYKCWLVKTQPYECSSFKLAKFDDCYIELVEDYPCENKQQLNRREGELIRATQCVNKFIAGRTLKEYCEENKDKRKANSKKHYEKNKEHLLLKQKQYQEKNKEHIKHMAQQRYEKNKADLLSVVTCEVCNCQVKKNYLTKHNKTQKHLSRV